MESNQSEHAAQAEKMPRRETIWFEENSATISPERGGIITSLVLDGTELLYMEEDTFADKTKNVRGGIPILFPNAGPIDDPRYPGIKQHGFARNSDAWEAHVSNCGRVITEILTSGTAESYPYPSILVMHVEMREDGTAVLHQRAENTGAEPMPVSMGLHPYFKVPNEQKEKIRFNFKGGERAETDAHVWMEGGTVSLDNPAVTDPTASLEVVLPDVGTLTLTVSESYKKIWIWSMPGKDFVCIEPVMRDVGGLTNDPEMIPVGQTASGTVSIKFVKV